MSFSDSVDSTPANSVDEREPAVAKLERQLLDIDTDGPSAGSTPKVTKKKASAATDVNSGDDDAYVDAEAEVPVKKVTPRRNTRQKSLAKENVGADKSSKGDKTPAKERSKLDKSGASDDTSADAEKLNRSDPVLSSAEAASTKGANKRRNKSLIEGAKRATSKLRINLLGAVNDKGKAIEVKDEGDKNVGDDGDGDGDDADNHDIDADNVEATVGGDSPQQPMSQPTVIHSKLEQWILSFFH